MRVSIPALIVVLLGVSACGDDTPTSPSDSSATAAPVTEVFTGTLLTGGTSFFSFNVSQGGTVKVMLATTNSEAGQPLAPSLKLGVGVPAGLGCGVSNSVTATAALSSQISSFLAAGTYCVDLSDPGNSLTQTINFNVRIVHP
jgi:hypothetical protein